MIQTLALVFFLGFLAGGVYLIWARRKKRRDIKASIEKAFPEEWRTLLGKKIVFYKNLEPSDKTIFEKRVQRFLATKIINGVDTEIDDTIRLMVASSAVIPTFAFPEYNYPNVHTVLIYPDTFDSKYQVGGSEGQKEVISGMVSGSFGNSTVILSKPDLVKDFDGVPHKENVGIHEFVHLLDKDDGSIDGVPELLLNNAYVRPWLVEIKKEIRRIEAGKSDINPYALTNNAEFLAVVSEYFFNNPEKFKSRHPDLYVFLLRVFHQKTK